MNHTCLFLPSRSWSSFIDPGGMEGWVDRGWLVTYQNVRDRELNPDTVAHLSTNWARHRLTSLIEANALTNTSHQHHWNCHSVKKNCQISNNFAAYCPIVLICDTLVHYGSRNKAHTDRHNVTQSQLAMDCNSHLMIFSEFWSRAEESAGFLSGFDRALNNCISYRISVSEM